MQWSYCFYINGDFSGLNNTQYFYYIKVKFLMNENNQNWLYLENQIVTD